MAATVTSIQRVIFSLGVIQDNTPQKHKDKYLRPSGIRTHNPSNQVAKTYTLDCAATGTSDYYILFFLLSFSVSSQCAGSEVKPLT
jgi:hypothetical protein